MGHSDAPPHHLLQRAPSHPPGAADSESPRARTVPRLRLSLPQMDALGYPMVFAFKRGQATPVKAPPLPPGHRILCSLCGEPRDAVADFEPRQLKKRAPRCRQCTRGTGSKFGNNTDGTHQSRKESRRAVELRALAACGAITNLREQVVFPLVPRQNDAAGNLLERPLTYIADFVYDDAASVTHVEDSKGFRTPEYRIKRKLMLWFHHIRIEEV
jgi:hypothetical protein